MARGLPAREGPPLGSDRRATMFQGNIARSLRFQLPLLCLHHLELAGLAQHYGVPTRLLDWTHDPLIAVYFASERWDDGLMEESASGSLCVWTLNTEIRLDLLAKQYVYAHLGTRAPLEFVTPPYNGNKNLAAQSGVFTHVPVIMQGERPSELDRRCLSELMATMFGRFPPPNPLLCKHRLGWEHRAKLRVELEEVGYGAARVFPGYYGVAKQMMETEQW